MPLVACSESVTQLLNAWSQGQSRALDRLIPLVYADLRRVARRQMLNERDDHLLQSTALVHEAFLRLGEKRGVQWASRSQFFSWMSTLMRQILVDHARGRNAAKRGDGAPNRSLESMQEELGDDLPECPASNQWLSLLQLDQALLQLGTFDARQARVVELRFFGGLSVEQTALVLDVSPATVKREWSTARAWLLREMDE